MQCSKTRMSQGKRIQESVNLVAAKKDRGPAGGKDLSAGIRSHASPKTAWDDILGGRNTVFKQAQCGGYLKSAPPENRAFLRTAAPQHPRPQESRPNFQPTPTLLTTVQPTSQHYTFTTNSCKFTTLNSKIHNNSYIHLRISDHS